MYKATNVWWNDYSDKWIFAPDVAPEFPASSFLWFKEMIESGRSILRCQRVLWIMHLLNSNDRILSPVVFDEIDIVLTPWLLVFYKEVFVITEVQILPTDIVRYDHNDIRNFSASLESIFTAVWNILPFLLCIKTTL